MCRCEYLVRCFDHLLLVRVKLAYVSPRMHRVDECACVFATPDQSCGEGKVTVALLLELRGL